ncbi:MAG: hypothetical protein COC01_01220 [Bacteroidetes bacterium]|nr:MAG: hypothetical protein COC01_01220 [Bacteroidota bacterium]
MPSKDDILTTRSEEVEEILSRTPNWFIRYGSGVFFITMLIIISAAAFIKYPDVINATAVITTKNPPVAIVARSNGKLTELYVEEGQKVSTNEVLAVIENPANNKHVLELKTKLVSFNIFLEKDILPVDHVFPSYELGEIQTAYSSFTKSLIWYTTFEELKSYQIKISAKQSQIEQYKEYSNKIALQEKALKEEVALAKKKYDVDSTLVLSGAIAATQFDDTKSMWLQKQSSYHGIGSTLAQARIQMGELERSILELKLEYIQERSKIVTELKKSLEYLNSQIASWEQKYLLITSIDGVVTFFNYWSENQTVSQGEEVMVISPENPGEMIGKLVLPIRGSAKVINGQVVNIKLDNYPAEEYGMIIGKISNLSKVPKNNSYVAEVVLPNKLNTTYNKTLEFKQQMQGSAEIITLDRTLMERVFNKFRFLFKKHL